VAAMVAAMVVEEEEEEGVVDHDVDCVANSNRGPIAHGNCKDSNKTAAPRTRRMTTTCAATVAGGIGIFPRKASQIIATAVHPIATDWAVAAELGTAVAVAAVAAAGVVGTAMEKMEEEEYKDRGEF
jgi:hypothetical protein